MINSTSMRMQIFWTLVSLGLLDLRHAQQLWCVEVVGVVMLDTSLISSLTTPLFFFLSTQKFSKLIVYDIFVLQQQCNSSLIFPDTQFGLSISDLAPVEHHDQHHDQHHSNIVSGHMTCLSGQHSGHNIALQPVILSGQSHGGSVSTDQCHDDSSAGVHCHNSGDKSPLPELTQLSSHDFSRGKHC